jgi:hypothetical protein
MRPPGQTVLYLPYMSNYYEQLQQHRGADAGSVIQHIDFMK